MHFFGDDEEAPARPPRGMDGVLLRCLPLPGWLIPRTDP